MPFHQVISWYSHLETIDLVSPEWGARIASSYITPFDGMLDEAILFALFYFEINIDSICTGPTRPDFCN